MFRGSLSLSVGPTVRIGVTLPVNYIYVGLTSPIIHITTHLSKTYIRLITSYFILTIFTDLLQGSSSLPSFTGKTQNRPKDYR